MPFQTAQTTHAIPYQGWYLISPQLLTLVVVNTIVTKPQLCHWP